MGFLEQCLVLVSTGIVVSTSSESSYPYFGSKTSYFVNAYVEESPVEIEGCLPALFWNLARHGTRNPGDDDIPEMEDQLPDIRDQIVAAWNEGLGELDEDDILRFMEWEFNLTIEDESLLTESGKQEHREMGERWATRLSDLIKDYDRTEVRSSTKSRCIESSKAFTTGIFGSYFPDILEDNHLMRFYSDCQKFQSEVDDNEETFAERKKFLASPTFQEMVTEISRKTGISLDVSQVLLIWDMCRYEKAWKPAEGSPWCSIFSESDLELFEFQEDLKYYYNDGAAYNITAQMTQPLFKDLFDKIDEIIVEGGQEGSASKSVLNFAHSETVQPFMTALGLYKDQEDLLASDWGTERQEHQWQVARIASFATNVGILIFECEASQKKTESQFSEEEDSIEDEDSSEEDDSSEENIPNSSEENVSPEEVSSNSKEWKVMMFHQERAVSQPGCGETVCSLSQFAESYRHLADQDFDTVCQNGI